MKIIIKHYHDYQDYCEAVEKFMDSDVDQDNLATRWSFEKRGINYISLFKTSSAFHLFYLDNNKEQEQKVFMKMVGELAILC